MALPSGVLLCATAATPAAGLACALRACDLDVQRAALPAARLSTAAAAAASARLVAHRRGRHGPETVIIRPMRFRGSRPRQTGRDWRSHLDGSLRAAFFVARAAALLGARRCAGIVFIIDPADARDALACVIREGLLCLADGLAKSVASVVPIGCIVIEATRHRHRAAEDAMLAEAILQIVRSSAGVAIRTPRPARR